ncbi:MAG TPA: GIY-YIG nuclease family protein [Burkholderiales bacterium]|nr:GIY-YIG nuclease family protein [Burkholderiales bacterium]
MVKQPCVYLLASKVNGTLYVGVTSDLVKRAWEHKNDAVDGFTKKYNVHTLVWYELHETMESAITREKAIKAWRREYKINLIVERNPQWQDLYPQIL